MVKKYISRFFKSESNAGKKNDGIKKIIIGKYELNAKEDHQLDAHFLYYPDYSQNFPRIAYEILKENLNETIIDIGANIGDTVALLRKHNVQNPVFCIEGDETYYSFLEENTKQFHNISLLKYYLSDTNEEKGYSAEHIDGTARIVEAENSTIKSSIVTLDKLSETVNFGLVRIIKIDTDGFDCKIIRGSLSLIEKYKPVLFFEYHYDLSKLQNEAPIEVLSILREKGYEGIIYFDNFGKAICITTLYDTNQLAILDSYIQNGKGAFPYYDVFVFHQNDKQIFKEVINREINLNTAL